MKQRSRVVRLTVLLAMLALTAACGGGSVDIGRTAPPAPLATGTFIKQFRPADNGYNYFPFSGIFDTKTQYLYRASEIGGSGPITKIRLQQDGATSSTVTCANMTVKMGHTVVSTLTMTWADNVGNGKGAEETVLDNATVTIPAAAADSWIDIPFTAPFEYNGVDNLVVDIERSTKCTASVTTTLYLAAGRRAYGSATDTAAGMADYHAVNAAAVDGKQPWMQFVFAGGNNTLDYGGASSNAWPLTNSMERAQFLYLASEITGSGPVTGMALQVSSATTTANTYTATVRMAHTLSTSLSMTWAVNYADTPTTAADEVTFTVPSGLSAGDHFWVPLPGGAFSYDGTRNLLVDIDVSAGTGNTFLNTTAIAGRRVPGYHADGAVATGAGQAYLPNITFRFNGGTMDVVPVEDMVYKIIMPGTSDSANGSRNQMLYRATELGTKGAIGCMSLRLSGDSSAVVYSNFSVVLGIASNSALGTSFSGNLSGAQPVFSGTLSIPAGMKAGDWLEIPFATAYAYDGVSNLVVQFATDPGSLGTSLSGSRSATIHPSTYAYALTRSANTASIADGILSVRLRLQ